MAPSPEYAYKTADEIGMASGAGTVASTEALTQVVFRLGQPVSVSSGRSLSVPIIDRDVPAARLALYQPGVHQLHPLASIRLRNDGNTGLPPGVLTIYEKGEGGFAFVGDARLAVLPAGEERMVSYALDQKIRIDHAEDNTSTLKTGGISRGVFRYGRVEQRIFTYKIAAPAREGRQMILELPKIAGFELIEPKSGVEETDLYWRVPVKLAAGKTVEVKVVAQRLAESSVSVSNLSDSQLAYYSSAQAVDAKARAAFTKLAALKRTLVEAERKVDDLNNRLSALVNEQERLRSNLNTVPRDSDLYRRYLKKLDDQETAIEGLQAEIAEGRDAANAAREAAEDFIAGL